MKNNYLEEISKIYNRLQDELSCYFFVNRLLYSITKENKYLLNIIKNVQGLEKYALALEEGCFVFGAGIRGDDIGRYFSNHIYGFIDNDSEKIGKLFWGKRIYSISELKEDNKKIIIPLKNNGVEIENQLKDAGVTPIRIIRISDVCNSLQQKQYFDLESLPKDEKEVFLDVGALDGKTSESFIDWVKHANYEIYMFEPDPQNIDKIKSSKIVEDTRVKIINKGAWNEKAILKFKAVGGGSSTVTSDGNIEIEVDAIDEVLGSIEVTFIKMDIEGAEFEALRGAEKIIRTQKPKLAICIYHKRDDIIQIPSLLLKYNPNYKFWIRHYSLTGCETVLYAV